MDWMAIGFHDQQAGPSPNWGTSFIQKVLAQNDLADNTLDSWPQTLNDFDKLCPNFVSWPEVNHLQ